MKKGHPILALATVLLFGGSSAQAALDWGYIEALYKGEKECREFARATKEKVAAFKTVNQLPDSSFQLEFRFVRGDEPEDPTRDRVDRCEFRVTYNYPDFFIEKTYSRKYRGNDRNAACAEKLKQRADEATVLLSEITYGGFFEAWCRVELTRIKQYE